MSDISPWIARLAARSRDVRSEAVGWARYIKPPRRDRVAIVTDTSAALPDEVYMLATGAELFVVPIPVMIGEQIYAEDDETLHQDLSIALASGSHIRTSRPSPGGSAQPINTSRSKDTVASCRYISRPNCPAPSMLRASPPKTHQCR